MRLATAAAPARQGTWWAPKCGCSGGSNALGWLSVAPLRRPRTPPRGQPVETGTVVRTYPFSAGTLAVEGGVPFGVAASTGVTFTIAAPRNKNRHMCWYGTSGAGKVYSLRVLLSRERFANGLRVYGVDEDEQHEYAGRFCDYLGGSRVAIRTVLDADEFSFAAVAYPRRCDLGSERVRRT
jgi:DNA helicase HerA-like ATPase